MTETDNSSIRAPCCKSFIRTPLKPALWLIVFATVAFAGTAAWNTLD